LVIVNYHQFFLLLLLMLLATASRIRKGLNRYTTAGTRHVYFRLRKSNSTPAPALLQQHYKAFAALFLYIIVAAAAHTRPLPEWPPDKRVSGDSETQQQQQQQQQQQVQCSGHIAVRRGK
jgi:hypothetical protein